MDKKEFERKVTEATAETFQFYLLEGFSKCRICGKRFMYKTYGKGMNERMIDHFNGYHIRDWKIGGNDGDS